MNWTKNLRYDLPASIVVCFVAVPLCLGIALASGAPLFSGLIAGIIGGIVVGILSGSPLGVSGPAAGLAVIVLSAITTLGDFRVFLLAVVLAGVIQVAMGLMRAGTVGYFFPSAVIKGMLTGIGLLICLKQLPHAVGYDADPVGDLEFVQPTGETTLSSLSNMLEHIDGSALLVSFISLFILIFWEQVLAKRSKIFLLIQGPVVAVAFGIVFQFFASRMAPGWALSPDHLVSVPTPGNFDEFVGMFTTPDWSHLSNSSVWVIAVTIAVVASLETLLCVSATDRMDPQKRMTPTNRELFAQGAGNIASGIIGGLPVTQVIVRSSTNIQSGGRTKVSAILHGAWLVLFVLVLPGMLNLLPLSVLAAILLVVGYKLAKPALFKKMWSLGLEQFLPFIVTVAGILLTDLLVGIGIGLAVAIVVILRRNYLNSHFLHIEESDPEAGRHRVRMRLSEEVTFLNKGAILKELHAVPDGAVVTIDLSNCVVPDYDVMEAIDDFRATAANRGIEVHVVHESTANPGEPESAPKQDRNAVLSS